MSQEQTTEEGLIELSPEEQQEAAEAAIMQSESTPETTTEEPVVETEETVVEETEPVVETTEEEIDFYKAVETITGIEVPVEYGEIDPLVPEGVALREKAIYDLAQETFDAHLRETLPEAYAFFMHLQAGGKKSDFFSAANVDVPTREAFDASPDLQATMVKRALVVRGVPEDIATATVDSYIKNSILKEKASEFYTEYEAAQQKQLADLEARQRENEREFNSKVNSIITDIESTISDGTIKYVIPETKRGDFSNYVKDRIRYTDGEFYATQLLTKESMKSVIESLFLQYSGNDLKSVIEKESRVLATKRLKTNVLKDKQKEKGNTEKVSAPTKYVPLGELFN